MLRSKDVAPEAFIAAALHNPHPIGATVPSLLLKVARMRLS
jgi:hypothetical protein